MYREQIRMAATMLVLGLAFHATGQDSRTMPCLTISGQHVPANSSERIVLDEFLTGYELVEVPPYQAVPIQAARTVKLRLGEGSEWELVLEYNDLRASGYYSTVSTGSGMSVEPLEQVGTYKGFLKGYPESSVRLNLSESHLSGYIRTAGNTIMIEPLTNYPVGTTRSNKVIVYSTDQLVSGQWKGCSVGDLPRLEKKLSSVGRDNIEGCRVMKIATEADHSFYQLTGTNTNGLLLHLLNLVEGIFMDQLGIAFQVTYQHVWTVPDPYVGADGPSRRAEFRSRWISHHSDIDRDVAISFTMDEMGSHLGYSTPAAICDEHAAFSIVKGPYHTLTAHELAHTLAMGHGTASCIPGQETLGCQLQIHPTQHFSMANLNLMNLFIEGENGDGTCLYKNIPEWTVEWNLDIEGYEKAIAQERVYSSGTVNVSPDAMAQFLAGERVILLPGFHAQTGSWFRAHTSVIECENEALSRIGLPAEPESEYAVERLKDLRVFPNPSSGLFTISLGDPQEFDRLIVYDAMGQMVTSKIKQNHDKTDPTIVSVDLRALPPGIYQLEIQQGSETAFRKLIIAR